MLQRPIVSIIIPLGYHRNRALECLVSWFALADSFETEAEIVAVAHETLDRRLRAQIQELFLAQTIRGHRLIFAPASHDAGQLAFGAAHAAGAWYFFTESHCIPEAGTLRAILKAIEENPDWDGFNGQPTQISPNRMAKLESSFYGKEIEITLTGETWRRVLDQCFCIRKEMYARAGGLAYGFHHFSEWLFSASLDKLSANIAFAPGVRVKHYNSGSVREVEEFTRDFCRGEIEYQKIRVGDDRASYFGSLPEWETRYNHRRDLVSSLLKSVLATRSPGVFVFRLPSILSSLCVMISGSTPHVLKCRIQIALLKTALHVGQLFMSGPALFRVYNRLWEKVIFVERVRHAAAISERTPDDFVVGAYAAEESKQQTFRWFSPLSLYGKTMGAGNFSIRVNLLPDVENQAFRVFHQGTRMPLRRTSSEQFEFDVCNEKEETCEFLFESDAIREKGGNRILGLPVVSLDIRRVGA